MLKKTKQGHMSLAGQSLPKQAISLRRIKTGGKEITLV